MQENNLSIFEWKKIRKIYDEKKEKWYFSIVDIVWALTDSINPTDYLKKLRKRDLEIWNYIGTNCPQVEMITETWKKRKTLSWNVEQIFRIIQSIPSSKAEPIKLWLARVGYERIQEVTDPEKSINRAIENWLKAWRSEKWITMRMSWQETRNKLTDYWSENEVKQGDEFAILTNIIHSEWTWLSVKEHKNLKDLKSQNLRDHMTEAELIFTSLAELSTRQIAETMESKWLEENKVPAKKWWQIAKNARKELEDNTWKSIVSGKSFLEIEKKMNKLK
jgi:hypothetical protein